MPFNPNDELEMRFTVTEWNRIVAQLQKAKYKIAFPLINKINLQAAQLEQQQAAKAAAAQAADVQAAAAQQQPADGPSHNQPPYTNGEMQSDVVVTGDPAESIVLAKDE